MKIRLFLLLASAVQLAHSQNLKIYNGVGITSNKSEIGLLEHTYCGYAGLVGLDYMQHKYFQLSSQLGYTQKGGKDRVYTIAEDATSHDDIRIPYHYLHVNTTFRIKTPSDGNYFYLGLGPKIDVLLNSRHVKKEGEYDLKLAPVVPGGIAEIGWAKKMGRNELGINAAYSFNFMDIGHSKNGNRDDYSYSMDNYSFLITFFVGIDIKGD